jgi:hypothetical protein
MMFSFFNESRRSPKHVFSDWQWGLKLWLLLLLSPASLWASLEDEEEEASGPVMPEEVAPPLVIPEGRPHFLEGEKLTYQLSWSLFEVGEADVTLESADFSDQKAWKILHTARTNGFADAFYRVRNRSQSYVREDFQHSLEWTKSQRESRTTRDIALDFDWAAGTVRYTNRTDGTERDPIPLLPGSYDPLSILYAVRLMPLQADTRLKVPTTNGKRNMVTDIRVVGMESIKTSLGRFDCWVVIPDTKDLGGVFRKKKDSEIRFWITRDAWQIPVRMSSAVAVGSFTGELSAIEGPYAADYFKRSEAATAADSEKETSPAPLRRRR